MKFDELYRHELDERERLRSGASITIGVLAIIGGLLAAMFQGTWFEASATSVLFLLLSSSAAISFCVALYHLICSYHGHV